MTMSTFKCSKCQTDTLLTHRPKNKGKLFGKRCLDCSRAATRKWQQENKERWMASKKRWEIERYGISESEYHDRKLMQNDLCAICDKPSVGERLHIDHCHATGKVRGLLCRDCNQMLGLSHDSITVLEKAAKYLAANS